MKASPGRFRLVDVQSGDVCTVLCFRGAATAVFEGPVTCRPDVSHHCSCPAYVRMEHP